MALRPARDATRTSSAPGPLLAAIILLAAQAAEAQDEVSLQLKWSHGFQFAGYYAARELGFYREAGLEVEFREATPGLDVASEVAEGRADFGVGGAGILVARAKGADLVALAAVYQHSPLAIAALTTRPAQTVHDLAGSRLMLEPHAEELLAYLRTEGISADRLRLLPHSLDWRSLTDGSAEALSIYVNVEPYYLERAGIDYQIHSPRSAGIDFYGDTLFTSGAELRRDRKRVEAFRAASLKGWAWALERPSEAIELVLRSYAPEASRDFLVFEASAIRDLVRPDLVELGYMNEGRWRHIAEVYAELGLVPAELELGPFLYDPDPRFDPRGLYLALGGGGLLLALASTVALAFRGLNVRLRRAMEQSEAALGRSEESESLLRAVMAASTAGIFRVEGTRITLANQALASMTGYGEAELVGMDIADLVEDSWREEIRERALARQRGDPVPERYELPFVRRGGNKVWVELSARLIGQGKSPATVATVFDVTERLERDELIRHMAGHDALTDLPNRALFSDRLERALVAARRRGRGLALFFIDLDRFKPVNDRHGHAVGDLLLKEVAVRLRNCLRASDTVGRIGGDEFVAFALDLDREADALALAEKLLATLRAPIPVQGLSLEISACIGIAVHPSHGENAEDLLKAADGAMYEAKETGRDGIRLAR